MTGNDQRSPVNENVQVKEKVNLWLLGFCYEL